MAEERMLNDEILLGLIKANGGGGGGTKDYSQLDNKPQINGNTLTGNKSAADLGLQKELTAGDNITIEEDGTISAESGASYTAGDYVSINNNTVGVTLEKGQPDVYSYKFVTTSTSDYTPSVKVQKYLNGTLVDETNYENSEVRTPVEFDGRIRFWYGEGGGFVWSYRNLVASNEHVNPTTTTWAYNQTVEYEETFDVFNQSTKLATQGYVDTALSGKQDTLTFDDVPTDNSNNPVKSNGIYDALALKQNATDNSLETDAKTIVGAINEHEGDISSLKSGFTNLDNEVNGDATTYPYADVITIEDAIPANLADCSVKIEPDQNLHGYDKPWVGGAGKNKLPYPYASADGTYSTVSITTNWDGTININGTPSGDIYYNLTGNDFVLPQGEYIVSVDNIPNNSRVALGSTYLDRVNKSRTITSDGTTPLNIYLIMNTNTGATNISMKPMIRLSTETDATFAPYTNICPITGHTEASVQRDGRNLLSVNSYSGIGTWFSSKTFPVLGRYLYRRANLTTSGGGAYTFRVVGIKNGVETDIDTSAYTGDMHTYNDVSAYDFVKVSGYSNNASNVLSDVMLCFNDNNTDTIAYVPYAGKTYTIALGDTVYGGTVDFDSGVMTVDRAIVDAGDLTYNEGSVAFYSSNITDFKRSGSIGNEYATYCISSAFEYHGNSDYEQDANGFSLYYNPSVPGCRLAFNKTIFDGYTTTQFKQWLTDNNVQVCYELATPFTVQLTPTQIQLLKGTNTITASTGQISVTVNGVSGSIGAVQEQVNEIPRLVNYSTAAQKTGQKWIDDRDVYMVVYEPSSAVVVANNVWTNIGMSASGIGTLLKIRGIAADGACCDMVGAKDNGNIICLASRQDGAFTAATFVVEYVEPIGS